MNNTLYKIFFVPGTIRNKIRWSLDRKKFKAVGSNFKIGRDYSFHNEKYISIGDNFSGGQNIKIHAWDKDGKTPAVEIGNGVTITDDCYISACNKVVIHDGVLLGVNTFVTDNQHGEATMEDVKLPPNRRKLYSKGPVIIEKNAWLGRNVCVMPGVVIGEGAIVGANSVVTHSIPAYCVAGGVPAKVIKEIK